jgi:hypothetical protein
MGSTILQLGTLTPWHEHARSRRHDRSFCFAGSQAVRPCDRVSARRHCSLLDAASERLSNQPPTLKDRPPSKTRREPKSVRPLTSMTPTTATATPAKTTAAVTSRACRVRGVSVTARSLANFVYIARAGTSHLSRADIGTIARTMRPILSSIAQRPGRRLAIA